MARKVLVAGGNLAGYLFRYLYCKSITSTLVLAKRENMDLNEISKGCKERALVGLFEFLSPFARNAIKIDTHAKYDGDIAWSV